MKTNKLTPSEILLSYLLGCDVLREDGTLVHVTDEMAEQAHQDLKRYAHEE